MKQLFARAQAQGKAGESIAKEVAATIVREIARFGGDVSQFVHPAVHARLKAKFAAVPK